MNFGILPLTFVDPFDYDRLKQGDSLAIDAFAAALHGTTTTVQVAQVRLYHSRTPFVRAYTCQRAFNLPPLLLSTH